MLSGFHHSHSDLARVSDLLLVLCASVLVVLFILKIISSLHLESEFEPWLALCLRLLVGDLFVSKMRLKDAADLGRSHPR